MSGKPPRDTLKTCPGLGHEHVVMGIDHRAPCQSRGGTHCECESPEYRPRLDMGAQVVLEAVVTEVDNVAAVAISAMAAKAAD